VYLALSASGEDVEVEEELPDEGTKSDALVSFWEAFEENELREKRVSLLERELAKRETDLAELAEAVLRRGRGGTVEEVAILDEGVRLSHGLYSSALHALCRSSEQE
jgi:hypothetical protein